MMIILYKNIKQLVQVRDEGIAYVQGQEMKDLPVIENAWLLVKEGIISDYGSMDTCPQNNLYEEIDCIGRVVMPAWCDSHTHIVYAGNREGDFVDRINGLSYEQIAERGGGILNSAKLLQNTSEEDLYEQSLSRLKEVMELGTGAIEIKSGYGLTAESELKMLRVIKRLKEDYPIAIKSTFLGAHAIPEEYNGNADAYIEMLIKEVLPQIAKEDLADYIDIFCEKGYFSVAHTEKLLAAAQKYGLVPKIHVNQFNAIGGVAAAVKYKALTVDHLELINDEDIEILKNSGTMPVALPTCSFFLSIPYTPARKIIDAGLPLALATDYNPGSTPSGNMNLVVATACIKMKMTPEEAMNAATLNGAYAMGVQKELGSITKGKKAHLMITKPIHSYVTIAYSFGVNHIESLML
ncbi:imidazolonepropionase [Plebeiibacterium sediminum]|uniref:Imidazolonepropionase n=1 Tax=Plebeiibacterium sediminum TaxID=2992112 RepID=A0AAE3M0X9_9BACT|nr:imidazolonepropionase [Plebeiobacterium sediminum]MCW3785231.1 imidazolonepropionase [Plebeiobacterium sediminum]